MWAMGVGYPGTLGLSEWALQGSRKKLKILRSTKFSKMAKSLRDITLTLKLKEDSLHGIFQNFRQIELARSLIENCFPDTKMHKLSNSIHNWHKNLCSSHDRCLQTTRIPIICP